MGVYNKVLQRIELLALSLTIKLEMSNPIFPDDNDGR